MVDIELPVSAVVAARCSTHRRLGVLELLLDIANCVFAVLTCEGSVKKLWSYFGSSGDCSRDGDQPSDFVCSQVSDARDKAQVVEAEAEVSGQQAGRCSRRSVSVEVHVVGEVLADQIEECSSQIWQESVGRPKFVRQLSGLREERRLIKDSPVILLTDRSGEDFFVL